MNHLRSRLTLTAKWAATLGAIALLGAGTGCNGNPTTGDAAYKEGELGNGDFLFTCDDTVACHRWSNDAKRFPTQIATGSNFDVRFVAKGEQGTTSTILVKDKKYEGITTDAIAPYIGKGGSEFAALKPGYGTVVVRDNRGVIIDYVTLKIVQPDGLVVYDASFDATKNSDPLAIQNLNVKVGETPSFRVVAEYNLQPVAGAIPVKWEPVDPNIVEVASYARGVVNLRAKAVGKTTLKAVGGGLTKEMNVEVSQ